MTAPNTRDTIVIGTSAGGLRALQQLLRPLPRSLPAALFVVQHQRPTSRGYLAPLLDAVTALPVRFVDAQIPIAPGHVYVAPPDRHLVLIDDHVLATREPRENRTRPAINPLFRTAAAARGSRTIAILLSGRLDDGVAGLAAVKRCGGITIVQDPEDAEYAELPRRALEDVEVDRVVPVAQMGDLLRELCAQTAPPVEIPRDLRIEAALSQPAGSSASALDAIAERAALSCPDCNGTLWKVGEGTAATYYCRIGHAFSPRKLIAAQAEEIERSLWAAVRALEERAATLTALARDAAARGTAADRELDAAAESALHAKRARSFLVSLHGDPTSPRAPQSSAQPQPAAQSQPSSDAASG